MLKRISSRQLAAWARRMKTPAGDMTSRMYMLAGMIIHYFLGPEWAEAHYMNDKVLTPYFEGKWTTRNIRDLHMAKVSQLGELLFNLQNVRGFDSVLSQLQTSNKDHNLEGTIAELETGRWLRLNGVSFAFNVASGVKGNDYDLIVRLGHDVFSADTKCKIEATEPSINTITETLRKAVKQLPNTGESLVFVRFPQNWVIKMEDEPSNFRKEIIALLRTGAQNAMRNSSRLAGVIFFSRAIMDGNDKLIRMDFAHEVWNERRTRENSTLYGRDVLTRLPKREWIDLIEIIDPSVGLSNRLYWAIPAASSTPASSPRSPQERHKFRQ